MFSEEPFYGLLVKWLFLLFPQHGKDFCHREDKLYLDVDECKLMTMANNTEIKRCHTNASCYNSIGSYICKCKTGYSGDGFYCSGEIVFTSTQRPEKSYLIEQVIIFIFH